MINFRPALPEDYAEIARITRDSYLGAGYFESAEHPYLARIQDVARRAESAQIWVAEQSLTSANANADAGTGAGPVVGAVTLVRHGEVFADIAFADELEIRILVVDPARQRGGIGRAMVQAIIAHARTLEGVRAVSLTTGDQWASAHALYRSMGFARQAHRDWLVPSAGPGVEIWLRVYRLELDASGASGVPGGEFVGGVSASAE